MQGAAIAETLRGCAKRPLLVIAFGKAARSMGRALVDLLPGATMRGLVVPPEPDDAPLPPFEVIAGGHPLPSAKSLRAARRALELAHSARNDEPAVFLVSGGGSAMLELPADPSVTLPELHAFYRALVGSGAAIGEINTVRRHLSAVKGGRLAAAARGAHRHLTLLVSDVPAGDDGGPTRDVASGPTTSDPTTIADCRAVLDRYGLLPAVPPALRARLERGELQAPPGLDDELFRRASIWVLLDERHARQAAMQVARERGWHAIAVQEVDDWPYERAADELLRRLDALHQQHPGRPVAVITTGELSVPLPADPGTGGRSQQFALYCARRIAGQPIAVLSCGTDGIDGNSPAAGAVVDGTTIARARALGLDADDHLRRCDAFTLLDAIGDTVITGPTGTNVRDVRVLVHAG